jgi:hypothetical protein
MSDRELADIGVSRGDLAAIADGTYERVDTTAEIVPLRPAARDRDKAGAGDLSRAA